MERGAPTPESLIQNVRRTREAQISSAIQETIAGNARPPELAEVLDNGGALSPTQRQKIFPSEKEPKE